MEGLLRGDLLAGRRLAVAPGDGPALLERETLDEADAYRIAGIERRPGQGEPAGAKTPGAAVS